MIATLVLAGLQIGAFVGGAAALALGWIAWSDRRQAEGE